MDEKGRDMNIYLSGMIGSGKTTLGRRMAARLGWPFLDLDEEMDKLLGYSFHRLVREQGWLAFRELEYSICKSFVARAGSVICLGGGTVRYEWNRDALRGSGLIILLEVSEEELIRRVRAADRPRVNPGTTLEEDIHLMWSREKSKYFEAADVTYRAEGKSPDEEVEDLLRIATSFGQALRTSSSSSRRKDRGCQQSTEL
jgi:shikimate kinase